MFRQHTSNICQRELYAQILCRVNEVTWIEHCIQTYTCMCTLVICVTAIILELQPHKQHTVLCLSSLLATLSVAQYISCIIHSFLIGLPAQLQSLVHVNYMYMYSTCTCTALHAYMEAAIQMFCINILMVCKLMHLRRKADSQPSFVYIQPWTSKLCAQPSRWCKGNVITAWL